MKYLVPAKTITIDSTLIRGSRILNELLEIRSKKETKGRVFGKSVALSDYQNKEILFNESFLGYKVVKSDIKWTREVARMSHLSLREKDEIMAFLSEEIDSVDLWECAMDVAIRGISLLLFYSRHIDELNSHEKSVLLKSLNDHYCYVKKNLEYSPISNNHLVVDCAFLNLYTQHTNSSKVYKTSYNRLLYSVINRMIDSNGFAFERSTGYSNIIIECLIIGELCSISNNNGYGLPLFMFPLTYGRICSDMYRTMISNNIGHLKDEELIYNYGDNDSGRVFCKSGEDFSRVDLIYYLKKYNYSINDAQTIYYTIKNNSVKVVLFNNDVGQRGKGGHNHGDSNQILLSAKNRPILVDCGNPVYTAIPELRNEVRSAAAHNTMYVGTDQIVKSTLFKGFDRISKRVIKSLDLSFLTSEVSYYDGHNHRRNLLLKENKVIINDEALVSKGSFLTYNLAPSLSLEQINGIISILDHSNKVIATIQSSALNTEMFSEITKGIYSPGYGIGSRIDRLRLNLKPVKNKVPVSVSTVIEFFV